jgi:phosphate transport system permease protein
VKQLTPTGRARYFRRQLVDRVMGGLCIFAAGVGLMLLAMILWMLFSNGLGGLSLDVFTKSMSQPGSGGGLANAIVGSLLQVGVGAMIGAPLGMMVGVYLSEVGKESKFASVVRFVNDILLSAPSVLIGMFVYQIAVLPFGGFSGFAGSLALAVIAMPIVARTTEDILRLVPQAYRDGAIALGSRENEVVRKVVLPAAFGGILTGILLAVARIAGETAPLLFTSLGSDVMSLDMTQPMASIPMAIVRYSNTNYADWIALAWTGAMLITVGVLLLNILSRLSYAAIAGKQEG